MRVMRVSKGFCGGGVRGQVRHAVGTCKADLEDREGVIGERERVTGNRQGLQSIGVEGAGRSRAEEVCEGIMTG